MQHICEEHYHVPVPVSVHPPPPPHVPFGPVPNPNGRRRRKRRSSSWKRTRRASNVKKEELILGWKPSTFLFLQSSPRSEASSRSSSSPSCSFPPRTASAPWMSFPGHAKVSQGQRIRFLVNQANHIEPRSHAEKVKFDYSRFLWRLSRRSRLTNARRFPG